MNKKLANYFFQEVSKAFAFVVTDHSFAPPSLDLDHSINFATVTFMGNNLAIECIFDEREADVSCKVARVIDGKKTLHYAVDDQGVLVRESLSSLVERHGRVPKFTNAGTLDLPQQIRITLGDYAKMLKDAPELLADSPNALT